MSALAFNLSPPCGHLDEVKALRPRAAFELARLAAKRRQLALFGLSAFRQNLADCGWSGLGEVGGESCRVEGLNCGSGSRPNLRRPSDLPLVFRRPIVPALRERVDQQLARLGSRALLGPMRTDHRVLQ